MRLWPWPRTEMTLVAVTRVLNEDDIVEAFVRHHATMVDHHLFLDNGSTDRTIEILQSLKDEGFRLTVLQNRTPFFSEVSYNTSLFRQARMLFGASWVLFLDGDEFLNTSGIPSSLSAYLSSMADETASLSLPVVNYHDLPSDRATELIIPLRQRNREQVPFAPTFKLMLKGHLADAHAVVDAGQHAAIVDGEYVTGLKDHPLSLGHYFRRSAWQQISKTVIGYLKVAAAGKQETDQNRSSHYKPLFESLRDHPEQVLQSKFIDAVHEEVALVEDPFPYLGGPLCYTKADDPKLKAVRVMLAYAQQLAENHGMFIDTNQGVRLQAESATSEWRMLI